MVNDSGKVKVQLVHTLGPILHREAAVGGASAGSMSVEVAGICLCSLVKSVKGAKVSLYYLMSVHGVGRAESTVYIFGCIDGNGRHLTDK